MLCINKGLVDKLGVFYIYYIKYVMYDKYDYDWSYMFKDNNGDHNFLGMGTVGEKGQIVIPAKARDKLKIVAGDQFIFFNHNRMMHMVKINELEEFLQKMTKSVSIISNKIKRSVKDNK